eukprot:TRINITY_DN3448_c0_g1_i5.p1 TRINITY_DN3448_c0_g1~~TRINITY_DN3448_c0_g1_i5.p1  ORF type:complete len:433 (-),score=86.79 TRINITY_DN3448_c0_g1_i5:225-1523(-)
MCIRDSINAEYMGLMNRRNGYPDYRRTPVKCKEGAMNHQSESELLLGGARQQKHFARNSAEIRCRKLPRVVPSYDNGNVIGKSSYRVEDKKEDCIQSSEIAIDNQSPYFYENCSGRCVRGQSILVGPFPGFLASQPEVNKKELQKKFSEDLKKQIEEKERLKSQQKLKEKEEAEREERRIQKETIELFAKHAFERAREGKLFKQHNPVHSPVNNFQGTVMEDTIKSVQNDKVPAKFCDYSHEIPYDSFDKPVTAAIIEESERIDEKLLLGHEADSSENSLKSNAKLVRVEHQDSLYETWKAKDVIVRREQFVPEEKVVEATLQVALESTQKQITCIDPDIDYSDNSSDSPREFNEPIIEEKEVVIVNTFDTDSDDESNSPIKFKKSECEDRKDKEVKEPAIANAILMYEKNKAVTKEEGNDSNSLVSFYFKA